MPVSSVSAACSSCCFLNALLINRHVLRTAYIAFVLISKPFFTIANIQKFFDKQRFFCIFLIIPHIYM